MKLKQLANYFGSFAICLLLTYFAVFVCSNGFVQAADVSQSGQDDRGSEDIRIPSDSNEDPEVSILILERLAKNLDMQRRQVTEKREKIIKVLFMSHGELAQLYKAQGDIDKYHDHISKALMLAPEAKLEQIKTEQDVLSYVEKSKQVDFTINPAQAKEMIVTRREWDLLDPNKEEMVTQKVFVDGKILNQDEANAYLAKWGGIGAEIEVTDRGILIKKIIPGNAGDLAGLRKDDLITKVDDEPALFPSEIEAVKVLRGKPGSIVHLHIYRAETEEEIDIKIRRDFVKVPQNIE